MPSFASFFQELLPDWMRRKDGGGRRLRENSGRPAPSSSEPAALRPTDAVRPEPRSEARKDADGR